ncbi:MAG: putative lipoprotein [Gammaproteobacteria bacterium]|nr:putative lipoprotein [Gammaproteobacteria bacterium]
MMSRYSFLLVAAALALTGAVAASAEPAPFDLAGPVLDVRVTHGTQTLPISQVPNLGAGDRLWIKADFPATQSAHYLMVVAFMRGSTNPPPANWFYPCETWKPKCGQAGLTVSVPEDAQQVLVFLAPETGGDFKTLVSAVRGRPGAFVRASQDLNQATLDRSRLEEYLLAIHALNAADPAKLKEAAPLLARSLAIKVDEKCLDRIPELQAPCLMQGQASLILNDGHSTSIVESLTTGPASDLAMEASFTPQLSYGYYSPYIASVLDIARIFESFRSAQYQYIPALGSRQGDRLALTMNTPPSFHNPKSVLVVALPAVEQQQLPPLHAVDPKEIYCARKTSLVLPVEGAPLVFSTGYAHDVTLSLAGKDGKSIDLPAKADAEQGGFVVDTSALGTAVLGDSIHGSLHGYWGFEEYKGPSFQLVNAHAQTWEVASRDDGALIVGREGTLHLQSASVSCVDSIMLKDPAGKELTAEWKTVKPNEVEIKLPLQEAKPGALTLLVTQYGAGQAQPVPVHAFSEAGHLDSFAIHAGDAQGILKGSRLDTVASLDLKGVGFVPGTLTTRQGGDELSMVAQDATAAAALKQGDILNAKVTLQDGRVRALNTLVEAPRPSVTLLGKSMQPSSSSSNSNIQLTDQDQLPQDAKLTFSVRTQSPAVFAFDEKIEVATADAAFSASLTLSNGGLTLVDSKVAVATLDPARAFGSSAFGPLQFRVIASGVAGDWQRLATLVRLPVLKDLKCPATLDLACKLSGSNLFLVDSVSNDPKFAHPVQVPDGFPGYALPVPHPIDGNLYVKLRDNPSIVNSTALGAQQLPPPSNEEADRAPARHDAHAEPAEPGPNSGGKQVPASGSTNSPTAQQAAGPPASSVVVAPVQDRPPMATQEHAPTG